MTTTPTIVLTGASDGIGLETARRLAQRDVHLVLHGRNPTKLDAAVASLAADTPTASITTIVADLSDLVQVAAMADELRARPGQIDVLINNAGVFEMNDPATASGLDARFVVNTFAPYLLIRRLGDAIATTGRVVNLSSAAQAPVDLDAMTGPIQLSSFDAYAQSKLALTMWNKHLADANPNGPQQIAVNPGSYLATKMVKEGFGVDGNDIGIGADILVRAALSDEFASASGRYWDNDNGRFAAPHPDADDPAKNAALVARLDTFLGLTD